MNTARNLTDNASHTEQSLLVWLVDDDADDNFLTRHALELYKDSPLQIREFIRPEDALQAASDALSIGARLPAVIFLDNKMPRMDGFEFMKRFTAILGDQPMPRVFMLSSSSAWLDPEQMQSSPNVLSFVEKPLTQKHLRTLAAEFGLR